MNTTDKNGRFVAQDFTGYQFENGYVISNTGKRSKRELPIWLCQCNCGNQFEVDSDRIRRVRSCGCLTNTKYRFDNYEPIEGEEWKPVDGYSNYEVSNKGRIRSVNYLGHGVTRLLSPHPDAHGFLRISLSNNGKRKTFKMHRLVAEAFVGKGNDSYDSVKHVDGDKHNNDFTNLVWVSLQEHIQQEYSTGNRKQHKCGLDTNKNGTFIARDRTGERHWNYVLLEDTGKRTKSSGHIWKALCDCGKEFEIPAGLIRQKKSCGCTSHKNAGTKEANALAGYKKRGFEVIEQTDRRDNNGNVIWIGKCLECGKTKEFPGYFYRRGIVKCDCEGWSKKYSDRLGRRPLPNQESHINTLFGGYIKGAETRGLEFSLTREQFIDIIGKNCAYCGAPPRLRSTSKQCFGEFLANGIDRVDNKKGYTLENSVPCCTACNYMKGTMEKEEFVEQVKRIYLYMGGD